LDPTLFPISRKTGAEISDFLVQAIASGKKDVAGAAVRHFGISRQAICRHLRSLVSQGIITASGRTRARVYALKPLLDQSFRFPREPGLAEDRVWRDCFAKPLSGLPQSVLDICYYSFTEMFNNAVVHSEGKSVGIRLALTAASLDLYVFDDGVGIFRKIKNAFGLDDERQAILELSKGKVTTDPKHHTGEGIFFTSRMFDEFSIRSGLLYFRHTELTDDWLIDAGEEDVTGTIVHMTISTRSPRIAKEVFDRYALEADNYGFARTHVPLTLFRIGAENLVSRSQARRVLARFDRFQEVMLDFRGVEMIGQAFADEIFRVFRNQNPQIRIVWMNANDEVARRIRTAMTASENPLNEKQ
jgi:anti-sigma regulatory factor (Ser/Thr protein kinase)